MVASTVANYQNPETPGLQDFGEILLRSDTAQGYIRCDTYIPDGLPTWGDGRLIILGTEGYLELRKYINIAGRPRGDHLAAGHAAHLCVAAACAGVSLGW